jgi:hypothetical protein
MSAFAPSPEDNDPLAEMTRAHLRAGAEHATTPERWASAAWHAYHGQRGLLLLDIDSARDARTWAHDTVPSEGIWARADSVVEVQR